jgi:transcriptional regulator with XRE-family HTH domain
MEHRSIDGRKMVKFPQVLERLMEEHYSRNRAELARAVFVSPSALSQYVRGKATPSLDVLVQIARVLGVSLDYLVFGEESASPTAGSAGYLAGQVEAGLRDARRQSAELHDLVARIGARLGGQVRAVAEEVLRSMPEGLGGSLDTRELVELEQFSLHTRVANHRLDFDVMVLQSGSLGDLAAPGPIGQVVINNIREGREYQYVLTEGQAITQRSLVFQELILRETGASFAAIEKRLRIYQSPHGCIPGFVVHYVDIAALEEGARDIFDRVAPFFYLDKTNPGRAYVAMIIPPSASTQTCALIANQDVQKLIDEHEWLVGISRRVVLRPHHRSPLTTKISNDGVTDNA